MSDKPLVYEDNGRIIYRASSFGSCVRALTAARLGYEPSPVPAKLQETFDAGHEAEEWLNGIVTLTDQQREVRLDIPGTNVSIVGHIDGMRDGRVVEVKSQSPAEFDKWTEESWKTSDLWAKYAWQASVYMLALNAGLHLIRVRRPEKNAGHDYLASFYTMPFHPLLKITHRVHLLNDLAANELLPACDTPPSYGCPYWKLHEGPEITFDSELDDAAREYTEAKLCVSRCEGELKVARERLEKVLGDREDVMTPSFKVKKSVYERKEYVVKAATQTRITVTEQKNA